VTGSRALATLRELGVLWDLHSIPRLAAALAFYAVLSLAPFLVLVVEASAMLFGETITQQDTIRDLQEIVGPEATLLISNLISGVRHGPSRVLSGVAALLLLLFGASTAFVELRSALNYIWGIREPSSGFIRGFVKERVFAFGITGAMALILVACLSASAAIQLFHPFFARRWVVPGFLLSLVSLLVSFGITSLTFSFIFRWVPDRRIGWKDACTAGLVTGAAFSLGRIPLDLYLSHAGVGSGYGAASSVVVFLMWIYVAAQIFYLGAEFAWLNRSNPIIFSSGS
jgi:membrane protein